MHGMTFTKRLTTAALGLTIAATAACGQPTAEDLSAQASERLVATMQECVDAARQLPYEQELAAKLCQRGQTCQQIAADVAFIRNNSNPLMQQDLIPFMTQRWESADCREVAARMDAAN